jgi:hypothetical protein
MTEGGTTPSGMTEGGTTPSEMTEEGSAPWGMIKVDHQVHLKVSRYNSSTFFLAQGVLRKKIRLDLMLGLSKKHLTLILEYNPSQP